MTVMTLEDYLHRNAILYPDKTAVICNGETMCYAELWTEVEYRAKKLLSDGLQAGTPIVFRTTQNTEFLIMYFAIHHAGGVAVPLETSTPDERFQEIETLVRNADIPRDTADILFTTGTTGKSKGVMTSNSTIIANAENLADAQQFSHDLTFIINGPLNHLGSLSKIFPTIITAGTLYILDGMKNINAFYTALEYPCSKFATFLVPSSIRMLLTLSGNKLKEYAGKLDFIETGAAPIAQSDMEQLCTLLPYTRLYNTYASTETGIICTHNFNGNKCIAGCLGRPMKHSALFITDEGNVACQGKTLMTGYVGDPALTASVLRDGILYTHDNGTIDEDGMLHLSGRNDDVINVGSYKIAPSEIEDIAMSMPEIADCICIAAPHPIMGAVLKLLIVPAENSVIDKKAIARYIRSHTESYKVPTLYETVAQVRRTYNGKLDRKHYRKQ